LAVRSAALSRKEARDNCIVNEVLRPSTLFDQLGIELPAAQGSRRPSSMNDRGTAAAAALTYF